jgi:hypothetical protein
MPKLIEKIYSVSRIERIPGEITSWKSVRASQIRALRGKYKDMLTPSDKFARQKRHEVALEG